MSLYWSRSLRCSVGRSIFSPCGSKMNLFGCHVHRRLASDSWKLCFLLARPFGWNDDARVSLSYLLKCLYISIWSPRNLLYASVSIFNFCSLSLYSMLPRPSTNLVAQICTFSSNLIYFIEWGAHTDCAYSRCGRTKAVNSLLNDLQSMKVKLRRMRPTIAFATRILFEIFKW